MVPHLINEGWDESHLMGTQIFSWSSCEGSNVRKFRHRAPGTTVLDRAEQVYVPSPKRSRHFPLPSLLDQ